MKKYIAYGSNLNVEQMRYRCPEATVYATGVIENYRLSFKGSRSGNYLTIEPADGYSVPVTLWEVSEKDEQSLDRYEGWPTFYRKENMTVKLDKDGTEEEAFAYIMNGHQYGVPTNRYYDTCEEGYTAFGFDTEVLAEAFLYSLQRSEI